MTTETDPRRGMTSASNAAADLLCPGRHLMQRNVTEPEKPNEYASIGNRVDDALNRNDPSKLTLQERTIYDGAQAIEPRKIEEFFGPDMTGVKVFRQERFWTKFPSGQNGAVLEHSGQADIVLRKGPDALIIDRKSLYGDVPEAADNLQLRDYAVLVKGSLVITGRIGTLIVQPLVEKDPKICVYTQADLARAEAEMFARVIRSNDPASGRVAGEVQCKFCRARNICPQYQVFAGGTVPQMLSLLDVPIASWTPEQRAQFCQRLPIAQKWLDDTKDAMKEGLERDPEWIPGYWLRPGAKRETITDAQTCFDRFAKLGGKVENFMRCVTVKKSALEESVHETTGARGKALDKAIASLTAGIVSESQNAPSLVKKPVAKKEVQQ